MTVGGSHDPKFAKKIDYWVVVIGIMVVIALCAIAALTSGPM
jgi:hypothetical protein